jgi:hypothetical protein
MMLCAADNGRWWEMRLWKYHHVTMTIETITIRLWFIMMALPFSVHDAEE